MSLDRRSREFKTLAQLTPNTTDLLSDEVDGVVYPYKRVAQCRVCRSSDEIRDTVDELLLYPKTYVEVLRRVRTLQEAMDVPEKDLITYNSIRIHQQRHLPFDKLAVRQIVEKRAREKQRAILDGADRLLTAEAFLEVVAQKSWKELVEGRATPSLTQGMQAITILDKMEKESLSQESLFGLLSQLDGIIQAVREVCTPEQVDRIVKLIEEKETSQYDYDVEGEDEEEFGPDEDDLYEIETS